MPLTFLGLDWYRRSNGDLYLTQERFTKELLAKHGMDRCKSIKSVSMDKLPEQEDPPQPEQLKELQAHAGAFNWLATRTRPDVSYCTSLLASSTTKYGAWSRDLAHKLLRYLAGTADQGLLLTARGDENDLRVYSDARFAGAAPQSQNGMIISWGGSVIKWRSSRAALSALSATAAEPCAAAQAGDRGDPLSPLHRETLPQLRRDHDRQPGRSYSRELACHPAHSVLRRAGQAFTGGGEAGAGQS